MPDIAIDPALAEDGGFPLPLGSPSASISQLAAANSIPASPIASTSQAQPAQSQVHTQAQRDSTSKPEGEPRLSHARLAVPEDPSIRPYGCNSPRCTPSYEEYTIAQAKHQKDLEEWKKAQAALDSDPSTAGQRPPGQHPSLNCIGVSFAASRDLLDHLRNAHEMRQKGEVHISQLMPGQHEYGGGGPHTMDELGEDGKMFRCALIGCQRTWKNANGLQYHCLTSVTAEEHNVDTVNRRRMPVKRKLEPSAPEGRPLPPPVQTQPQPTYVHYCPYRERLNCQKQYKHRGGVKHHLEQIHSNEPDYDTQLANLPSMPSKRQRSNFVFVPSRLQPAPRPLIPQSGMFTHGYIFSHEKEPYRPTNRPIDALYYLNVLATSGVKTHHARASERLLVNALLNADLIKSLQDTANNASFNLDVVDENGNVFPPDQPLRFPGEDDNLPFTKGDVDRAILKLAATLQSVGFGDNI